MTSRRNTGALAIQAAVLIVLGALLWFAANNAIANLTRLGINTGFGFLRRPAGFAISQTLIPYSESSTYLTALAVAALNTVLLAALSIALATPIGFMIGLGRRSPNGLLRSVSTGYVELLRNVPLLLQLFFWYFALLRPLPPPRQSLTLLGTVALNARGLFLPVPAAAEGSAAIPVALLAGIVLAAIAARLIARRRERSGDAPRTLPIVLALALGPAALAALATGVPFHWDVPHLQGFNYQGGIAVQPELVAMTLALSLYSAAYIAEIVRAGLDAVPRGQIEAARALGLRPTTVNGKIVVPQALRVIVPPLGNEYLRLFRNTTLAAAIGYPDLTMVFGGTVLNQTAQAFEVMLILCAVYLAINGAAAALINWYNRRIAVATR